MRPERWVLINVFLLCFGLIYDCDFPQKTSKYATWWEKPLASFTQDNLEKTLLQTSAIFFPSFFSKVQFRHLPINPVSFSPPFLLLIVWEIVSRKRRLRTMPNYVHYGEGRRKKEGPLRNSFFHPIRHTRGKKEGKLAPWHFPWKMRLFCRGKLIIVTFCGKWTKQTCRSTGSTPPARSTRGSHLHFHQDPEVCPGQDLRPRVLTWMSTHFASR